MKAKGHTITAILVPRAIGENHYCRPANDMNPECLRCLSGVHSTNSNFPTSTGFSQRQFFIFAGISL
jgi:hypothetical protein